MACYIWYSEEGTGRVRSQPRPLLAVPNVTAHPSTASVPTSYYLMWQSSSKELIITLISWWIPNQFVVWWWNCSNTLPFVNFVCNIHLFRWATEEARLVSSRTLILSAVIMFSVTVSVYWCTDHDWCRLDSVHDDGACTAIYCTWNIFVSAFDEYRAHCTAICCSWWITTTYFFSLYLITECLTRIFLAMKQVIKRKYRLDVKTSYFTQLKYVT